MHHPLLPTNKNLDRLSIPHRNVCCLDLIWFWILDFFFCFVLQTPNNHFNSLFSRLATYLYVPHSLSPNSILMNRPFRSSSFLSPLQQALPFNSEFGLWHNLGSLAERPIVIRGEQVTALQGGSVRERESFFYILRQHGPSVVKYMTWFVVTSILHNVKAWVIIFD